MQILTTVYAHLFLFLILISFSEVTKNSKKWDTRNANSGTAFKIILCIILTSYEADIILAKIVCNGIFPMLRFYILNIVSIRKYFN